MLIFIVFIELAFAQRAHGHGAWQIRPQHLKQRVFPHRLDARALCQVVAKRSFGQEVRKEGRQSCLGRPGIPHQAALLALE
ncbi:hypothetical protein D3C72_832440 [compost metagenome]